MTCKNCVWRRGDHCQHDDSRVIDGDWVEASCHRYMTISEAEATAESLKRRAARLRKAVRDAKARGEAVVGGGRAMYSEGRGGQRLVDLPHSSGET